MNNTQHDILLQDLDDFIKLRHSMGVRQGWKYSCLEELIRNSGVIMKNLNPSDRFSAKGEMGACYQNCVEVMSISMEYAYCEGYALHPNHPIPVLHSWLLDNSKRVVDPTWKSGTYYGIIFNYDWVMDLMNSRSSHNCLGVLAANFLDPTSFIKLGLPQESFCDNVWQRNQG